MLASFLIIGFSLILLVYWFRYSCMLMLRSGSPHAMAAGSDNRFSFARVPEELQHGAELDPLCRSLDHDYKVISYLIEHAPGLGSQTVEERLLALDYKVMQCYYAITRTLAPLQARRAVLEMASVLGLLAQSIDEHAGVRSEV